MSKQNFSNNGQNQPCSCQEGTPNPKTNQYLTKPSGLGQAGAILNIIWASFGISLALFIATWGLYILIVGVSSSLWAILVFVICLIPIFLMISCIISSARFLKGKQNKVMAGILGILTGFPLGGIFIFCSYYLDR